MIARVAHEKGQTEPDTGDDQPGIRRSPAQSIPCRREATDHTRDGDSSVASELVQPHREAPALRSHEVDLHDDGHRPREPLVDAEERVRPDDPPPVWRVKDHQWYWKSEQPSREKGGPPGMPVSQPA